MRATMSVPPPAPKPTTTRIGLSAGHSATAGAAAAMMTPAARAAAIVARFMVVPPKDLARLPHGVRLLLLLRERGQAVAVNLDISGLLILDRIPQHAHALDLNLAHVARLHPDRLRFARMADAGRRAGEDD